MMPESRSWILSSKDHPSMLGCWHPLSAMQAMALVELGSVKIISFLIFFLTLTWCIEEKKRLFSIYCSLIEYICFPTVELIL